MKKYYLIIIILLLLIFINIFVIKKENNNFEDNCIIANNYNIGSDNNCIYDANLYINNENVYKEEKYLDNQIGYIRIRDTNIDSAIMQYTDNEFYLTHDNNGNYSIFGSIYMDFRNSIYDKKILFFGHNTKNAIQSPFKDLEKYGRESFYKNHSVIELELDGIKSKWKIFSIVVISNKTNRHMKLNFKDDEWMNHLKWLKDNSLYKTGIDVSEDDRIIILQTCYYNPDESFIIVSAKEI